MLEVDDAVEPVAPLAPPAPRPPRARRLPILWESLAVLVALVAVGAAVVVPTQFHAGPQAVAAASTAPKAEGPNIIGVLPFSGPATAQEILDHCRPPGVHIDQDCVQEDMDALVTGKGSEVAFNALQNLTYLDADIMAQGHPIAHGMGRVALEGYGGPHTALLHCPYVLASGCFHGVLQSYFDTLDVLTPEILRTICSGNDPSWVFQCLHGMGHGLQLYRNYDLPTSLEDCEALGDYMAVESCRGGVFMENLVGFADSETPTEAGGHNHGGKPHPPPTFWINKTDLNYPCDAVADKYVRSCYAFQPAVSLHINGYKFPEVAAMCHNAGAYTDDCFQRLGQDAGANKAMDPVGTSILCELGNTHEAAQCIKGYAGDAVNDRSLPQDGIRLCNQVHDQLRESCLEQVGYLAKNMTFGMTLDALCATAEPIHVDACRRGAGL